MSSVYVYNNKLLLTQSHRALAPKTRRLPAEYQEVEWIGGTGTQYIRLNHKLTNNSDIKMTFSVDSFSDAFGLFGSRDSASSLNIGGFIQNDIRSIVLDFNNSDYAAYHIYYYGASVDTKYTVIANKNRRVVLNESGTILAENTTYCPDVFQIMNNATVLKQDGNTFTPLSSYGKLYSYEDGASSLVPCYRISDNVIGMYDMVTETFYTNAGTGTFTKGADV